MGIALQRCGQTSPTSPPAPAAVPSSRPQPSFLVVVMDDARFDDLRYMDHVPVVMASQGITFSSAYVSVPLCAPSRASILTGRYAHNHGVWSNDIKTGGYVRFHDSQLESQTIAVRLQAAGYRTMLAGKYLNHYAEDPVLRDYVPPGWDEWYVPVPMNTQLGYTLRFKDALGRQGWEPHGNAERDYEVDVLRDKTIDFIRRNETFFAYVAPVPPHIPHVAAARFRDRFQDLPFPKPPSFNEPGTPDKPYWVRSLPRITAAVEAEIIEDWRARLRSMLAVDEMVKAFVDLLAQLGRLDRTYIIVTSDNGWLLGEHRYTKGKDAPYEEASRAPLVVRGPDTPAGETREHPVSLVDLAPTLLELARATGADSLDGVSLAPLLGTRPPAVDQWRPAVLFEAPQFAALRARDYVYINWKGAFTELYDVSRDPYQMRNLLCHLDLEPNAEAIAAPLAAELADLVACHSLPCRQ